MKSTLVAKLWGELCGGKAEHAHGRGHGHGYCAKCGHPGHAHHACGYAHQHWHDKHACCEIPETCCPPRCVGKLDWKIQRGALPEATILVRNVGDVERLFQFSATPLSGAGAGTASLSVSPPSAQLKPGETQTVQVKLVDSAALRALQDYRAEVLIEGAWQQCVEVFIHVAIDPFDNAAVEQSNSIKDRTLHPRVCKSAIDWKIQRGVTPEGAIAVHNTGKESQTFNFEAGDLIGPAAPGAGLSLLPDSAQLGPGQSAVVRVKLQNTAALSPGQSYQAEIRIHGFYEQCAEVRAFVLADEAGHVTVEQGESPTRKRAHHWYDHFQCTESCVPGAP